MAGGSRNTWADLGLAVGWLALVAVAVMVGAWATFYVVGFTVRAWLWLLLHALPYWLAVVPAFLLSGWTFWQAWRLLLLVLPARGPSREL